MENVAPSLRAILSKFIGKQQVDEKTELFHQLGIAGDDAAELLEEIHERFGTSFSGFQFDDFFPDEPEALGAHLAHRLGFRDRRLPLTFGHLTRVIERGCWFEP